MKMQAFHHKLDVVLVQILRYNCSETDYSFREDSPPAGLRLLMGASFNLRPLQPPLFFLLRRPCLIRCMSFPIGAQAVVTESLSRAVSEIMGLKDIGVSTLTFQGHDAIDDVII